MKILVGPKRSGRTTQCIELAAAKFLYIVCRDKRCASEIFQYATEGLRVEIPFPLTYDELLQGQFHGRGINGFIIDDLDELLRRLTHGMPLDMVTFENASGTALLKVSS